MNQITITAKLAQTAEDGTKRVLRFMPRQQLKMFINCFNAFLAHDPAQLVRSCITCDNFDEKTELCRPAEARPPARIIAFGCERYNNLDDDIPF